jgi:hypothetical protein
MGLPPTGASNAVAVYCVMGVPPREMGAPQATATLDGVVRAVTPTGALEIATGFEPRQDPPATGAHEICARFRFASSTKSGVDETPSPPM